MLQVLNLFITEQNIPNTNYNTYVLGTFLTKLHLDIIVYLVYLLYLLVLWIIIFLSITCQT